MRIECPHCKKVYNIPDERLPAKRKVAFPCPACKGSIKIDTGLSAASGASGVTADPTAVPVVDRDDLIKKILTTMNDLPPMPQVVTKAYEIMADPGSSFKELGDIIGADPAIAARVLKLANSAYYGLRGEVSSVHQASVVLGYKALGELITVVGAAGIIDNILEGYGLEAGFLWQHSLAVAFGSRLIAKRTMPPLENDAFSAGLLHDAGKIVLDGYVLENEKAFEDVMADRATTFLTAEKKILGIDHGEIASELCETWGIPEAQRIAIKYHHTPAQSDGNKLAYMLHVADVMAMKGGIGTGIDDMLYEFEEGALDVVGLDEAELEAFTAEVVDAVDKITREVTA